MTKTEMLRQLAAAKYKPAEEPTPTEPTPTPATKEQVEALSKQIETLIRQRKGEKTAASMNELADLVEQMAVSLAMLSEEYRGLLPRIMDEPRQQTAAMVQEAQAAIREMKEAATSLNNAAKNVQHATKAVNGLRIYTWLCQAGTAVLVCLAFLFGFMIWQHRFIRADIMEATKEAIKAENLSAAYQPLTEQLKRLEDRLKRLGATGTKSGSAPKAPTETPQDSSTTSGAPPK